MTESDWLYGGDLLRMASHVAYFSAVAVVDGQLRRLSARKFRLIACACCRYDWHLMTDPRSRAVVEAAELFADGLCAVKELRERGTAAWNAVYDLRDAANDLRDAARAAAATFSGAWDPGGRQATPDFGVVAGGMPCRVARKTRCLQDVAGNPFRPAAAVDRRWLTPEVLALAEAAYDERQAPCPCAYAKQFSPDCQRCHGSGNLGSLDPARLAVLADALEEAGCADVDLLRHLRGRERCPACLGDGRVGYGPVGTVCPECLFTCDDADGCRGCGFVVNDGPHVKGCWALDLVLGRE